MTKTILKRVFYCVQLTLLIAVFGAVSVFAAGEVDPAFNAAVQESNNSSVQRIIVQPDGKFLVAGAFGVGGNAARGSIARFNPDGTIDESFNPPDFYRRQGLSPASLSGVIFYAVALQSDGKIIVGGVFDQVGTFTRTGAVRLNANGSFDASFNPTFVDFNSNPGLGSNQSVADIVVQADNKIVLGGIFQLIEGSVTRRYFARVNADGSIDASFTPSEIDSNDVRAILLQPDGKIVYAASTSSPSGPVNYIRRVNTDGSVDNSFLPLTIAGTTRIARQADGKILVAAQVTKLIIRLNENGALDNTFNPGGTGANGIVRDILVLADGKILIGGYFILYNGASRQYVAKLNADGTLDTTFTYTGAGIYNANAVALLNDGTFVVGGSSNLTDLTVRRLIRINANGTRDLTFSGDVYLRGIVYKVFPQTDGKILIGGAFSTVNGTSHRNVARLNANGTTDTTFNGTLNGAAYAVAGQSDGKVLAGGMFSQANNVNRLGLARFNTDGSLDTNFAPTITTVGTNPITPIIYAITVLSDGKILIAGKFRLSQYNFDLNVARLNADGTTDMTFNESLVNISGVVRAMKFQQDGKIVVGGTFTQIAGAARGNVARLNADGTLDATFNPSSGTNGNVYDLAIQSNGNITVGGDFNTVNGVANRYYLAQLFPDGSLNQPFYTLVNNVVFAVERQADDKILVGSYFNIDGKRGIARFNPNGTLDASFGGNGTNENVTDIFIQNDNNILIGGDFTRVNNVSRPGIARLLNAATTPLRTPYDFDGDGKADLTVFRPSNGVWYLQQSTSGFNSIAFGISSDIITPGDFDGDGKTDVAVFRPANGAWYLQRSSLGFTSIIFGSSGDIPVPGDYDGDGKADVAVFRPSNGAWYIQQSTSGFTSIVFGASGDKPVAADYDGDGKTDLAVFRTSNGVWYIQRSQLGFTSISFGDVNDKPVPADYDGDGKAELAVFRPSTGYWFTSTNPAINYGAVLFGANGDLPVPADYDGDGKIDIAVFRPSNGVWYLNRSTQGFTSVPFGVSEDKPIPNAFVR